MAKTSTTIKAKTTAKDFTCCECKLRFPVEILKSSGGKKYCPDCWEKVGREANKEKEVYKELTDYIKELFESCYDEEPSDDVKTPFWGMIGAQIKLYTNKDKDYHYSFGGILYTLKYIYKYEPDPPDFVPELGIGMIPYYYMKAKAFCLQALAVKQAEKMNNEEIQKPEIIVINRSDLIAQEEKLKEKKAKKEKIEEFDLKSITEDLFDTSEIDKKLQKNGIWGDE